MSKKVLIYTEGWAGSGHRMAAVALKQALEDKVPKMEIRMLDGLREISPLLQKISNQTYHSSLRYAPGLWEKVYNQEKLWGKTLKKPLGKILARRILKQVVDDFQPDHVIATHAYCLSALCQAKRKAIHPFQLTSIPTDFYVNNFWIHPEVDYYVVAHEHLAAELKQVYGIPDEKVRPFGIPIRPGFARDSHLDKSAWKSALGLKPGVFTVLLSGGEGGYGNLPSILAQLLQVGRPLQILVITGRNEQLRKTLLHSLQAVATPHLIHILGFVESMWAYQGAADLIISKPGGLTCSEAMSMGTPLLFLQPLPGQEQHNGKFLEKMGVAKRVENLEEIPRLITRWQIKNDELEQVAHAIRQHRKPDAAYRVADLISPIGLEILP